VCGDGIVTPDEQCDDHNTASGDCCSPTCRFEAADSACATDANACTRDVCNGAGVCIHPAGNAGAVCRAAAGVCDVAETCNGTSVACPADAKSTAPCRAAAGVCDKAESCNGVDVACPADAFEPSATVCRPSAGECDVADTCTGTSAACGADVKSVAQCRAANGSCDVAESCDGAGNACPSDGKAPDGTSCSGDACSGAGMCSGGVCGGESTTSCGPCEACDPVAGCVPALQTGCLRPTQARKAQFQIKDSSKGEVADQLSWKWLKGDATSVADFGDPTTTDGMSLCVFDRSQAAPRLIFRARVSPGRMCGTKPCWIANGAKGFKYADTLGTPDGITQMTIAPGVAGKARILVRGKGANLSAHAFGLPAPPLMLPLTVQLQSATGKCWETDHSAAGVARNTPLEFNGKSD
jgi:cysteine-rich repeat protein